MFANWMMKTPWSNIHLQIKLYIVVMATASLCCAYPVYASSTEEPCDYQILCAIRSEAKDKSEVNLPYKIPAKQYEISQLRSSQNKIRLIDILRRLKEYRPKEYNLNSIEARKRRVGVGAAIHNKHISTQVKQTIDRAGLLASGKRKSLDSAISFRN